MTVHHVYGLHDGPEHFRLQEHWKLYECYDLDNWEPELNQYVVFADTGTGELFAISGKDGSVWFYEHDFISNDVAMPGRFSQIETSFSDFLSGLQSNEEYEAKFADDSRHIEFKARLEKAKAQRARFVQEQSKLNE